MNEIPAGEIRAQLQRILSSDGFREAGRLGPFLEYVVDAALAGRTVEEAQLGSEVFGRAETAAEVSSEARLLRSRLADFYRANTREPVRIDLPEGGYVPAFSSIAATTRRLGGPAIVIGLIALTAAGIGWLFWARARAMNSPVPAVAVLPFRGVPADPANDYFSDGLTIELIDALTKVEQLRVVSWNSAARYRGKARSFTELRDQLRAGSVLDGTVRRFSDRLLITAELIDTNSGQTIWSDKYDRPAKDIFQVEEEIAKSIVYSLKVQLRVDPQRILVPPRTDSQEAYDDYLRARYFRNPFSREGLLKSNEFAEKAIGEDPKYPPPYAVEAANYALLGFYRIVPMSEAAAKAKDLARKSIALDSSSSEAHAALGFALGLGDWDWKGAQLELDRAIQWSPGSSDAHSAMAIAYLAPMGQLEAAEYEARKAVELDPLSFEANSVAGEVLLARGKYQESIDRFRAALAIYPGFSDTHWDYGMALAGAGRTDEAPAELAGNPGPMEEARSRAVLGDRDLAFAALDKAIEQRDPRVVFLQSDTRLGNLKGDPRFEELLRRLHLK